LGNFVAEDNKSFSRMAKENGIEIMTSCGIGSCGICKCKIIDGYNFVQKDKISKPL
jgi:ferredoxin